MPLIASLIAATIVSDPAIEFRELKEKAKDQYSINIVWPEFKSADPIYKLFNTEVKEATHRHLVEFKQFSKEAISRPAPWEHFVSTTISHKTSNVLSAIVETYDYSGGAHPNTWSETINIGMVNGKPKSLILKDLLNKGVSEQQILDYFVLPRLSDQRLQRSSENVDRLPEGTNAKFIISKNGLTFPFDKYSVASYAEGEFIVKVSWKELKGLINPKAIPYAVQ